MAGNFRFLAPAILAIMCVACTKPMPVEPSSEAGAGTSSVILYNAYTSSVLAQDGSAGEPRKTFAMDEKIYVGVVLHGNAGSSKIKAEWSRAGSKQLDSDEIDMSVAGAAAAAIDATKHGALASGEYKVLVYLDGTPSWELGFTVK